MKNELQTSDTWLTFSEIEFNARLRNAVLFLRKQSGMPSSKELPAPDFMRLGAMSDAGLASGGFETEVREMSGLPGIIEIALATGALLPSPDGVHTDRVAHVTGLLKCNVVAAQQLRDALNFALSVPERPSDPMQAN